MMLENFLHIKMYCRFVLLHMLGTCMSFNTIYAIATLRELHSLDLAYYV
jgi:hypothetical protein